MIRAKHTIRHNDTEYKKGTIIDGLSKMEESRLVNLKAADFILSPVEELKMQKVEVQNIVIPPHEFEELRAALDTEFNAEDLKREARDIGVDLTGITKKDDVIAAIINQGKADQLLEDVDGEDNE